jgi:diguanylate cyclase (GGDEF)-like protein
MLTQKPLLIENFEETEYYHQDRKDKYKKKSSIILPLIIYNKLIGIANLNNRISGEFDTLFLEHITRTFEHISNSIENSMLFKQMEKMAVTDELTKIYNRRYFFDLLSKEASKFERYKRPFVILMIDIDNFKNFNDSYGHINGDKILKIFAQLISENIREFDIFARYGGEEFVLLLSEVDIKTGEETAERLRKVIEENCYICCNNKKVGITISGGLTEYHFGQSPEDVLNKADKALYKSKKSGKNMISLGE